MIVLEEWNEEGGRWWRVKKPHRDLALQEDIRRAGALAPLLKDCPTDAPVRIAHLDRGRVITTTSDISVE